MNAMPRISVVIPSWNSGKFIEQAILSVLHQEYQNLEFIVFDNVSADETPSILEKYRPQLAAVRIEPDRGQSDAINKGMALATGDILCWLNADDLFLPGCMHKVARAFREMQPDILTCDTVYIDAAGKVDKCILLPEQRPAFYNHGLLQLTAPANFFAAHRYKAVGGVDETLRLSMDVDLFYRILRKGGKIRHLRGYMGAFRWHDESKTSVDVARRKTRENSETRVVLDGYLGRQRKTGLYRRLYQLRLLAGLYPLRRRWDCHKNRAAIEAYISGLAEEAQSGAQRTGE